jgi:very-short-patch-repair endonuclease
MYKNDDNPHPFRKWLTSEDIWKYDEEKLKFAKENGYEVLTVWDSEYRKNPEKILSDCLQFLCHSK